MARYKVIIDGGNIKTVQKKIKMAFPGQEVLVEKVRVISSRPDRFAEAEEACDNAKSIVEELKGEMEEWHENIPMAARLMRFRNALTHLRNFIVP